jgi:hypothetical protein
MESEPNFRLVTKREDTLISMKLSIKIFGATSNQTTRYIKTYDVKESAISHAVRAMLGMITSRIESVLISAQT